MTTENNKMDANENPGEKLKRLHNIHLKAKGVKLPKRGRLLCALEFLVANMDKFNHIDDIKSHVAKSFILTGSDPLQLRHLSTQKGFHIIKEGRYKHKLKSLEIPCPSFISAARNSELSNEQWETMLLENYTYGGIPSCVNCGSQQGMPLRWKLSEITVIQKGHCDPRKPLSVNNCIPQCQFCNQSYKNNYVFDKRGRVKEVL